ncbi:MAG: hypothetical protein HY958_06835 [Bacteroidia bacterium]|nr:hypothetical protein [Bacteroidia bacterium]
MKTKIVLPALFIILFSGITVAQSYKGAIGARFGFYNGITLKGFTNSKSAFEGMLVSRWHGIILAGLYEYHFPVKEVKGLNLFLGGGLHFGYFDGDRYDNYIGHHYDTHNDYTVVGGDLIFGAEYTFKDIPLNVGLDWKPAINFVNDDNLWFDGVALSIRYTFSKK